MGGFPALREPPGEPRPRGLNLMQRVGDPGQMPFARGHDLLLILASGPQQADHPSIILMSTRHAALLCVVADQIAAR